MPLLETEYEERLLFFPGRQTPIWMRVTLYPLSFFIYVIIGGVSRSTAVHFRQFGLLGGVVLWFVLAAHVALRVLARAGYSVWWYLIRGAEGLPG